MLEKSHTDMVQIQTGTANRACSMPTSIGYSTFIHIQIHILGLDIHEVMFHSQGDFRPCINLNIELVHWEMARMLMRYSLCYMKCVCHLVVLTKYFSNSYVYAAPISVQLSSTSDLGPKGRSSDRSVTEMQSQHESNPYGPTTRAALPSITAEQPVSNYSGTTMHRRSVLCFSKVTHNVLCFHNNVHFARLVML